MSQRRGVSVITGALRYLEKQQPQQQSQQLSLFQLWRRAASGSSGSGTGSRLDSMQLKQSTAAALAATKAVPKNSEPGFVAVNQSVLDAIPPIPKALGFAGALPFLFLTPQMLAYLGFDDWVQKAAQAQVAYGALIVSFLGAVHWGMAMSSPAAAAGGARAAAALRERYIWSVTPCLGAWSALVVPPAPGALCVAVLLGICYLSDRSYTSVGALPKWYGSLRGYLTTLAMLGMLSTAAYFFILDVEKAKRMDAEEAAAKQRRWEEEERAAAAEAAEAEKKEQAAKKKKWW